MLSGRDSLGVLNQHIDRARDDVERAHRRLEELNQRVAAMRSEFAEHYRRLARIRLDEMNASRLIQRLDDTDRAVLQFLERRSNAMRDLESRIEASAARQSELTTRRETQKAQRDDAFKAMEDRYERIKARLSGDDAYEAQTQRASEAAARAEKAEEKAARCEQDREEKGKPYRDDPLFMYLWQRGYLTPEYRAGGLIRILDGWVARLVGYGDARGNYFMLNELPLRLREHANGQKQTADQELQILQALELKAAESDGIPQLRSVLEETEESLHAIDDEIEAEEKRHDELLNQRAEFLSFSDEHSRQALDLYAAQLKDRSMADLQREALATSNPDDDLVVSKLRSLQQEELQLTAAIQKAREDERRSQQAFRELESVRRRFRRSNYDSDLSFFPGGFELAMLLGMLMQGRASSGDVWDRISREQQFRRPRVPRDFGGGISLPGRFGGGGFRGGGGFGGGGFRTGGGF